MSQPSPPIVVIGASAGGVQALLDLVAELPAGYPGAVFVVLHIGAGKSMLPDLLARAGPLLAEHARHGDTIQPGRILVAPPDAHLLVREDRVELSHGPRENHSRPAVDPLFRTAARAHGSRVTGVILSGALSDGVAGLLSVKSHGGITIVQDPDEALFSGMPDSAIRSLDPDYILPAGQIGTHLATVHGPVGRQWEIPAMDPSQNAESVIREDFEEQEHDRRNGELTMFTCPDCGGSLWQANVGHAWGPEALVRQKSEELEAALWSSVRLFEERATLSRQVGARLRASGEDQGRIDRIAEQALFDERRANAIREVLDAPLHGTVTILENGADGH
jgi:two-component system chemotaxis response regulator CheB